MYLKKKGWIIYQLARLWARTRARLVLVSYAGLWLSVTLAYAKRTGFDILGDVLCSCHSIDASYHFFLVLITELNILITLNNELVNSGANHGGKPSFPLECREGITILITQ